MIFKKQIRRIAILYLCFFNLTHTASGQATSALKIGDTLPEMLWDMPLDALKAEEEGLSLSAFKGKPIILDFWATWCSPCVSMIPKLEALQEQFDGKVQILPITYQDKAAVAAFLARYGQNKNLDFKLPSIVGDKWLSQLFPHTSLPHYVWIDAKGVVTAITGLDEVNKENIFEFTNNTTFTVSEKIDPQRLPYDVSKPLFVNGNGGNGNKLMYHALITGYSEGLISGYNISNADTSKGRKITARNLSLVSLYQLANGDRGTYFGKNRTIVDQDAMQELSPDSTTSYMEWMKAGHGFCFELIVPYTSRDNAHQQMRQILKENFPNHCASVESRKQRCLVLKRISSVDKIRSKGGNKEVEIDLFSCRIINAGMDELTGRLAVFNTQTSPLPIIDGTCYNGNVDILFEANLTDLEAVNEALKAYDLAFVEEEREIEMLVIGRN